MQTLIKTGSVIASCLLLSACLSYTSDQMARSGSLTDHSLLMQIVPGETSAAWLVARTGDPESIQVNEDGAELWRYSSVTQSKTKVRALPLVAVELNRERQKVFHFKVEGEVITHFWEEALN